LLESYPAGGAVVAPRIAALEGVNPADIIVGNGAVQCIEWACLGWGFNRLLVPTPTFSTYYEVLGSRAHLEPNISLSTINHVDLLDRVHAANCDALLIIHPNNPTGDALELDELKKLIDNSGHIKIIIDESFSHFLEDYASYRKFRNECISKNVIFIKSMSKDFGIAGVRLGYMITRDDEIKNFAAIRSTWNLNNFAVTFTEFLNDSDFVKKYWEARSKYLNVRQEFFSKLSEIVDVEVFKSQSNFFLIKLPESVSRDIVFEMLIESGVYVRTMEDKIGLDESYIRVACRRPEENDVFINTLRGKLS
jgi:histidinol-phosphate/aromatic aminotransferase/cobyric acid decarboxylase-like protein